MQRYVCTSNFDFLVFRFSSCYIPGVKICSMYILPAAAVLRKSGEPLQVEEIQVDPPKSTEIRIKMLCASMCHTDILCCNGLPVVSSTARSLVVHY